MIDNSGDFHSAPKYARSFSVNPTLSTSSLQEIPSLQEVAAKIFVWPTYGKLSFDLWNHFIRRDAV